MKKKFLAMYALAGALVASPVFTSCIDSEESASVTAVRNAKAEQIKNATAIAQAQAEYDAKMDELNLAIKQLELEAKEMSVEEQKIKFDKIQAETEQAIAYANYYTAYYTKLLYQYQDEILTELTGNYTGALNNIIDIKRDIYDSNAKIYALENGIVSIQEHVATQTKLLNDAIAAAEAKIAIYKDAEGGVNQEEVTAEIVAVEQTITKLTAEKEALQAEYNALATVKAITALNAMSGYTFVTTDVDGYSILSQSAVTTYKQSAAYGQAADNLETAKETLAALEAALGTEADKADTKYQATATTKALTKYAELAKAKAELETAEKAYAPLKEALDKALAAKNEKETALNEAIAAENENTDATKAQALADAKAAAETAFDAAVTAYNTANTALTADIINAYTDAVSTVETKELAVAKAIDEINTQKLTVAACETAAETAAEFETYLAAFSGDDYAAYKAAYDALDAKNTEMSDADAEKEALQALQSLTDIEALIATEEETIATEKAELAALEEYKKAIYESIQTSQNGSAYGHEFTEAQMESLISIYKDNIAQLEIKLALEEKRAEQAKAALDAYLGTEEEGEAEA